jgi:hypothetical protein
MRKPHRDLVAAATGYPGGRYGQYGNTYKDPRNRVLESSNSLTADRFGSVVDGYGSYSGGSCCPLVVDPLTVTALVGFIGAATFFLNTVITMSTAISMIGRRRRRDASPLEHVLDLWHEGESCSCNHCMSVVRRR